MLGRGKNSKGLGTIGIDLLGKYERGFRICVWDLCVGIGFRVQYLKVWEREFGIGV